MALAQRIEPGTRLKLRDVAPAHTGGITRDEADARLVDLNARLTQLQELLYAAGQQSVLIILQGLDTAGKDGTIKHVMAQINPSSCRVESFKQPTPEELAHDFLWRAHRVTPPLGAISIFNRSYYEDVLVVRVHGLVPEAVWRRRYGLINDFERLLAASATVLLKFYLHISKEEQQARLLAREADIEKAWKLSTADWPEHDLYDQYIDAYQDVLRHCSTAEAPWYIVPADHKWFRNLAVAETIVAALEPFRHTWQQQAEERGRAHLAARAAQRAAGRTTAPGGGT